MRRSAAVLSLALIVGVAGCGTSRSPSAAPGKGETTTTAAAASPKPEAHAKPTGRRVKASGSSYGRILLDGRGRALYLFTHDAGTKSRCHGACVSAWPPFLTKGQPRAAGGVSQSLLGTTRRSDGSTQVTYAGHPLYHYVGDTRPGQILCQAVLEYGGYWYVVKPDGTPVR